MPTIPLVGAFIAEGGGAGARVVEAVANTCFEAGIRANLTLAADLRSALTQVLATAVESARTLGFCRGRTPLGMTLEVDGGGVETLEDTSFGLPVYTALLADLTDLQITRAVTGTGGVSKDGTLFAVDYLREKADAAQRSGFDLFAFPGASVDQFASGVPVETARSGASLWLGLPLLEVGLERLSTPRSVMELLEDFLDAHRNPELPPHLPELLRTSASTRRTVEEALKQHHSRWLIACLKDISRIPEEKLWIIRECLYPLTRTDALWQDPAQIEQVLIASVHHLRLQAADDPIGASTSCLNLLRISRRESDLGRMLSGPSALKSALLNFQESLGSRARKDVRLAEVMHEVGRLAATLEHTSAAARRSPQPEDQPTLTIHPRYGEGRLEQLDFSFPDHPEVPASILRTPAALLDESSGLPPSWRRRDWSPTDAALSNLPNGQAILGRFGFRNEIIFPVFRRHGTPTRIIWGDGTGTWPPSIDTLHLCGTLAAQGYFGANVTYRRVLDLGCGTGVHGILLAKNSDIEDLDFIDSEPGARLTTATNVIRNFHASSSIPEALFQTRQRFEFAEGVVRFFEASAETLLTHELGDEGLYDLVICTPPYVPFVQELHDPLLWRAVSGTDLIRFVLKNWRSFSRRTIIQFSDLALPEIQHLLHEAVEIDRIEVAFRIPPLAKYFDPDSFPELQQRGQKWLERCQAALIDTESPQGRSIIDHGFRYFHTVRTYLLDSNPRS